MVVAAMVKHDVQQRSANERLVEFHAAGVVCEEMGADSVTGDRSDKDRSNADRSFPEAAGA